MNLNSCTSEQRKSIQYVSGPLLVSAGAGSGKTFTLTQRIAYALLEQDESGVSSIDEVLAITFTEKAAGEIKSRVKQTLRAEGLGQEALKVDGAWISTIHGMCSRILKTHAFDLGIDPQFSIVSDTERKELINRAINMVLSQHNGAVEEGPFALLFSEYSAQSFGYNGTSVASMLFTLIDKATGIRGGLSRVNAGPCSVSVSVLARQLLMASESLGYALEDAGESATAAKARDAARTSIEVLSAFVAEGVASDNSRESYEALARVIALCGYPSGNFSQKVKAQVGDYQATFKEVLRHVAFGLARPLMVQLIELAQQVCAVYESLKSERGKLDNDDLLTRTLDAFEQFPELAARYEKRFKLVMVDEFQDTSQLQIDMIARLTGENFKHLCTVGDAQQSIYRFRGADVNVYEQHKTDMRSDVVGARYIELSRNFRSHQDVLSLVDRVFEQPSVFGSKFMSLEPYSGRTSQYQSKEPRINLALMMKEGSKGAVKDDLRQANARYIAKRFAAWNKEGHCLGDMVVLLGKMTNSLVYAQALREAGLDCVVAGGSQFASTVEVELVASLLEALANPYNTTALFAVLTSDILKLSADDLLQLGTQTDEEGRFVRRDISKGIEVLASSDCSVGDRLEFALNLFQKAQDDLVSKPLSAVALRLLIDSGWFGRLEQGGAAELAVAANILKALRIVRELEEENACGPTSVAQRFKREMAGMSEAPGALSGSAGNVVRIMTIHASKGLEFPLVALADFAEDPSIRGKLLAESTGKTLYCSLWADKSLQLLGKNASRLEELSPDAAQDVFDIAAIEGRFALNTLQGADVSENPVVYRAALMSRMYSEELAEAHRKLYVGLTRASEALLVCMDGENAKNGLKFSQVTTDILSSVFPGCVVPELSGTFNYRGTEPGCFHFEVVERGLAQTQGNASDGGSEEPLCVPRISNTSARWALPFAPARSVFSYSSASEFKEPQDLLDVPGAVVSATDAAELVDALGTADTVGAANAANTTEEVVKEVRKEDALVDEGAQVLSPMGANSDQAEGEVATNLGSAFHRAAQYAVETGHEPSDERIGDLACSHSLTPTQTERLLVATKRWFASSLWHACKEWKERRAEVPFYVALDNDTLEGEIDLLCTDATMQNALVVDYKTGGLVNETPQDLFNKHWLQAACYAYVLLRQGFAKVELCFVRVEQAVQPGHPMLQFAARATGELEKQPVLGQQESEDGLTMPELDNPQVVSYCFVAKDAEELERRILALRMRQKRAAFAL